MYRYTRYFKYVRELVFPRLCAACTTDQSSKQKLFCQRCDISLPYIKDPLQANAALIGKEFFPPEITSVCGLFYFKKDTAVAEMVHRFKYEGHFQLATQLGALLVRRHRVFFKTPRVIVPVPVHHKRLKNRGYNQSLLVAKGIRREIQHHINHTSLIRAVYEESQTGKSKYQRASVLEKSFALKDQSLRNQDVLLVDDVITTGSTIAACFKLLEKSEVRSIAVATVGISI